MQPALPQSLDRLDLVASAVTHAAVGASSSGPISRRTNRTTGGSRILRDFIPRRDAAAVSRLRNAGAITLGKLNLHEFAYGVTNGNPFFGIARNPHDPSRIPGGSSGGSAIAVVAGLCAASIGSDTGGSIRIPAALCGCVGLKPTYGAVPLDGVIPLGWSLDHAGPIARTVSDAALLYAVLTGQPPKPVRRPRGLRIGVLSDRLLRPVERGVAAATERALERLQGAGARLREVALPELSMSVAAQLATLRAEASALHRTWLRSRPRDYGRDVRLRASRHFLYFQSLRSGRESVCAQACGAPSSRSTCWPSPPPP